MKYGILFCLAVILLISAVTVSADQYTFVPSPSDVGDLDHEFYYAWMISWTPPIGQTIVGAQLSITNINNWGWEPNQNWLYIHIIDARPSGGTKIGSNVWRWRDNAHGGNNWAGSGVWVATYTDNSTASENLSYDLGSLGLLSHLNAYASDGYFGFGFDPDCHYYNSGVSLKVTTTSTPEPAGFITLASGLFPVGALIAGRRIRKR